jgi:hypothetical protein
MNLQKGACFVDKTAKDSIGEWYLIIPGESLDLEVTGPQSHGIAEWSGAPARAVLAKQIMFPSAPVGRYLVWFHQDEHYVKPGDRLNDFVVKSSYRPGLTTAWVGPGKLVEFDQSWPREIFEQLQLLENRRWREKYVLTVGPMFAPNLPTKDVAERFRSDISEMEKGGWLDATSPFCQEAAKVLNAVTESTEPAARPSLAAPPRTPAEQAVAEALRVTLGIQSP